MCVSCGCKQFDEDHGDSRNLTMKDFEDAAQASEIDLQQVARNIQEGLQSGVSSASGGTSRGSGGFDDSGKTGTFGHQGTEERTMPGNGTQYETTREGDYEETPTGSRGGQGDRGTTGNE
jgi:hypothetical protein